MGSEMNSYWLTLAMGLFICWLLVFVVKHMCWGLIRSGIDWSSFRKLNVLPAPPWSLTQGKDTKEDQRQRYGQAEVKGYSVTAISLIGWGQVKVRLAEGHLESRPGFWSKLRVTLMLSRESFDGKSKCRCSTPALSGTSTSQDAAVKLISGAGDTTILWVTQCSLSGKLIKSASPQGPHVAKMATSSLSGPPAALPMTSLSLSAHKSHFMPATLLKWQNKSLISFSTLCRQSSWNQRNKAKRNSAAPKLCFTRQQLAKENFLKLPPKVQQRHLHQERIRACCQKWIYSICHGEKVDCFSFPCLKYNPAIFKSAWDSRSGCYWSALINGSGWNYGFSFSSWENNLGLKLYLSRQHIPGGL